MRKAKPTVPIVMLSAYYDLPASIDGLVNARLVKGESTQVLLDTVARLLARDESMAQAE